MRVFLDTNIYISAFATRGLCADLLQVVLADHQLVIGETVIAELRKNFGKKLGMPPALIEETEAFLRAQAEVVSDAPSIAFKVRDPSDRWVVAEAFAGRADALVTGDNDLLSVAAKAPIRIVAPRAFWELLKAGPQM